MFSANSASASSTRSQLLVALALQLLDAEHAARAAARARRARTAPPAIVTRSPSREQLEGIALLDVDQRHPGLGQQQRPGVRVAPVGGRRGVDHGAHPGRDQLLGGDPVDVDVIDDGDIAGREAFDQVLGAPPEPSRAFEIASVALPRYGVRAEREDDGDWR